MGATLLSPQTLQQADRFPDEEDEPAYSISQIALDFAQEGRKGMKTKSQADQVFFVRGVAPGRDGNRPSRPTVCAQT
jgi:hypothetical protein